MTDTSTVNVIVHSTMVPDNSFNHVFDVGVDCNVAFDGFGDERCMSSVFSAFVCNFQSPINVRIR